MKEETGNWLKQAEFDLESAEKNLEIKQYYVSAFMAQQSTEKALKAFIIEKKEELLKIHSVSKLAKEADLPKELIIKISNLEPIYQETRYPDVSSKIPAEEFEEQDSSDLINISREVLEWIKKELN